MLRTVFNSSFLSRTQGRSFCAQAATAYSSSSSEQPTNHESRNAPNSTSISYRRVPESPVLPLEAVALPEQIKQQIHQIIKKEKLTPRDLRKRFSMLNIIRAPETYREKLVKQGGMPVVRSPPVYGPAETASYLAIRFPGTFTANVYAMAEIKRQLPQFAPKSILDFGAGAGTSTMAAARLFNSTAQSWFGSEMTDEQHDSFALQHACLVDKSKPMRIAAEILIRADPCIQENINTTWGTSIMEPHIKSRKYDLVCASYSLNEVVREAISTPLQVKDAQVEENSQGEDGSVNRFDRVKLADKRLRRTLKALWSRTAPGGLLVVIEDGTAAGFETVSFAREFILNLGQDESSHNETKGENTGNDVLKRPITARVIAPCLHSEACPLKDSITRHRICRFEQRLNRPLFTRTAKVMPTGYEDEYLSFIVIQKLGEGEEMEQNNSSERWGRLIRRPLLKGKHVALDACTNEGKLERRIVSKKNKAADSYARARRAKWGDIWAQTPTTSPHPVNF